MSKKRIAIAMLVGVAVTASGTLPFALSELVFVPGILLSLMVGTGTVHESSAGGLGVTLVVIYLGSVIAWSALAYALMSLRAAQQAVAADRAKTRSG